MVVFDQSELPPGERTRSPTRQSHADGEPLTEVTLGYNASSEMDAMALDILGPSIVHKLKQEFRDKDKRKLGWIDPLDVATLLRTLTFCPTETQVKDLQRQHKHCGINQMLSFACEVGLPTFRKKDLTDFFVPYDEHNTGWVTESVFRNLMENAGDSFSGIEIDDILSELQHEGAYIEGKGVQYISFLDIMIGDLQEPAQEQQRAEEEDEADLNHD